MGRPRKAGFDLRKLGEFLEAGATIEQVCATFKISERTYARRLAEGRALLGATFGRVLTPAKAREGAPELPAVDLNELTERDLKLLSKRALGQILTLDDEKFSAVRTAAAKVAIELKEDPATLDPKEFKPFSVQHARDLIAMNRRHSFLIGQWVKARLDRLDALEKAGDPAGKLAPKELAFDLRLRELWIPNARRDAGPEEQQALAQHMASYDCERLFVECGIKPNLELDAWKADVEAREAALTKREAAVSEREAAVRRERWTPEDKARHDRERERERVTAETKRIAADALREAKDERAKLH